MGGYYLILWVEIEFANHELLKDYEQKTNIFDEIVTKYSI